MNCHSIPSRSKGFTLLEVLVTVIILAIGLLGLAGLQITGMKFNHSSYLRSQSSLLAYDILDRMRANELQALTTGSYAINFDESPPGIGSGSECWQADCDTATMANFDLYEWKTALADTLPEGDGQVSFQNMPNTRIYTIQIRWRDRRLAPGQEAQELQFLTYRAEL